MSKAVFAMLKTSVLEQRAPLTSLTSRNYCHLRCKLGTGRAPSQ